jgi:biotin operon repressor
VSLLRGRPDHEDGFVYNGKTPKLVLRVLRDGKPHTTDDLARDLGRSTGTIVRAIHLLRRRHAYVIATTPNGYQFDTAVVRDPARLLGGETTKHGGTTKRRIIGVLQDGRWHDLRELILMTAQSTHAVSSGVRRLRLDGYDIRTERVHGRGGCRLVAAPTQ